MVNIGYLYFKLATKGAAPYTHQPSGSIMDRDELYFQSATWLRRALLEHEENPEALYLFAKLYEEGYSVDKDIERAVKYIQKAADLGFTKALTKLAHYHYSGYSDDHFRIPMNKQKALELYEKALTQGDSEAANCLGLLYESWPANLNSELSKD